jgi:hypothetical protein
MMTIKTKPDCTLGFVRFGKDKPETEPAITIIGYPTGKRIAKIGNSETEYEPINLLSDISEEQARELVDLGKFEIIDPRNGEKMWADLNEVYNFDKFYKSKLKEHALSVGIEEKDFDKYLIIKL